MLIHASSSSNNTGNPEKKKKHRKSGVQMKSMNNYPNFNNKCAASLLPIRHATYF